MPLYELEGIVLYFRLLRDDKVCYNLTPHQNKIEPKSA